MSSRRSSLTAPVRILVSSPTGAVSIATNAADEQREAVVREAQTRADAATSAPTSAATSAPTLEFSKLAQQQATESSGANRASESDERSSSLSENAPTTPQLATGSSPVQQVEDAFGPSERAFFAEGDALADQPAPPEGEYLEPTPSMSTRWLKRIFG